MTAYVLLTDDDNGTLMVECLTDAQASEVASAAVWSDGGVSAWLASDATCVAFSQVLVNRLRGGDNLYRAAGVDLEEVSNPLG